MVNPLAAALGPVGGLAACACCLLIIAIWGLFATTIALAVYTKDWRDAIRDNFGLNDDDDNGAVQMLLSHTLLIGVLCVYGYMGLRRAFRAA